MATTFPRAQFKALISTLSGLDESLVNWWDEAQSPIGPIGEQIQGTITITTTSRVPVGWDQFSSKFDVPTQGQTDTLSGIRNIVLTLRAESLDRDLPADDLLELLRSQIFQSSSCTALRAMGLVLRDAPSINGVPNTRIDQRGVTVATMEIQVAFYVSIDVTQGDPTKNWIEKLSSTTDPNAGLTGITVVP